MPLPLPDLWLRVLRAPEGFRLSSTRLGRVSADALRARAPGEVKKPETVNHRTHVPEAGGLYCAQIFGAGPIVQEAPRSDAPVTEPRAITFGRYELPCPIVDPLALAHAPDEVADRAGVSRDELAALTSYQDPDRRTDLVDRLAGREDGAPLLLHAIPVLPPYLRPMAPLAGGRWATASTTDLYRRVINRGNRLRRLLELSAPPIILSNEQRMLSEAIHALGENEDLAHAVTADDGVVQRSLRGLAGGTAGLFEALTELDQRHAMGGGTTALPHDLHRKISAVYALGFELEHSVLTGMGLG